MDTDIVVTKRKRGRPRKVVSQPSLPIATIVEEPEETIATPIPEATEKKIVTRKPNPWIDHCKEVQARPENAGKSYRDVLKLAKLEYTKKDA